MILNQSADLLLTLKKNVSRFEFEYFTKTYNWHSVMHRFPLFLWSWFCCSWWSGWVGNGFWCFQRFMWCWWSWVCGNRCWIRKWQFFYLSFGCTFMTSWSRLRVNNSKTKRFFFIWMLHLEQNCAISFKNLRKICQICNNCQRRSTHFDVILLCRKCWNWRCGGKRWICPWKLRTFALVVTRETAAWATDGAPSRSWFRASLWTLRWSLRWSWLFIGMWFLWIFWLWFNRFGFWFWRINAH